MKGGSAIDIFLALNDIPFWFFIILLILVPLFYLFSRDWTLSIFIPYLYFILGETVLFRSVRQEAMYHLEVFWSYREWNIYWPEILTNIILFIPFGALLSRICGWKHIFITVCFSSAIEIIQLIMHLGIFEFDDIIHNTAGSVIF